MATSAQFTPDQQQREVLGMYIQEFINAKAARRPWAKPYRTWMDRLETEWANGQDAYWRTPGGQQPMGHVLRSIRNNGGPAWLDRVRKNKGIF